MRSCDPGPAPPGWRLLCVAVVQAAPGMRFARRAHDHSTVECVLAGRGLVRVGGEERMCVAGDSYLLPEGEDHLIEADRAQPWRKLFINVRGPLLAQLRAAYGVEPRIFPACDIAAPLRRLLTHRGDDRSLHLEAARALHEVVALWHASASPPTGWPEAVVLAKARIDQHLEDPLSLAEVARAAGCSEAHLSRQFRRHVGLPPGAYIGQRRMELAKALLSGTAEPITAIAERLCYADAFAFSHAFRQHAGCPPTRWRERGG